MRLIVGLGNPGREYVGTRHNVGFEAVDTFARKLGLTSKPGEFERVAKNKFEGLVLDGSISVSGGASVKLLLLEPMTYMNLSGRSVQSAMAFYGIIPADVMVVLDDLALPCGKIRIRGGGSSGGHNGLKDIERALSTNQYPRLRIGIDAPPTNVPGKDYVLGRFSEAQRPYVDAALNRATSAIQCWIERGLETAMSQYNGEVTE